MPLGLQVFNVVVLCLYLLFCILPLILRDGEDTEKKEEDEFERALSIPVDDDLEDD